MSLTKGNWTVSKQAERWVVIPENSDGKNGSYVICETYGPDAFQNAKAIVQTKQVIDLLDRFVKAFDAGESDDWNLRDEAHLLLEEINDEDI